MKCLIIAAGKGNRLRDIGDCKPLIPVLGVPLIERVIRTALKGGVGDFYVTIGYQADKVRAFLDQLAQRLKIRITLIVNEDWEKENGLSVLKAKGQSVPIIWDVWIKSYLYNPIDSSYFLRTSSLGRYFSSSSLILGIPANLLKSSIGCPLNLSSKSFSACSLRCIRSTA